MEGTFTVREIATALSVTPRAVRKASAREAWQYSQAPGRGGQRRLYRLADLPEDIQRALLRTRKAAAPTAASASAAPAPVAEATAAEAAPAERTPPGKRRRPTYTAEQLGDRWGALTDAQRQRADAKLAAIRAALAEHERDGTPLSTAFERAAADTPWSAATLRDAYYGKGARAGLVQYPRHLWAPALAPGHLGRVAAAECDPAAWQAFKADYLRPEAPPLAFCYRTLQRLAAARGWTIPRSPQALRRRLEREVSRAAITLARQGEEALGRLRPAQIRDRAALRALEAVCADGHQFDVFVAWPDGQIARPLFVAWQDLHSGKLLAWRLDRAETAAAYRLAFHDLLRDYGVPEHVVVDNGRGIASKALTGGCSWRYRGKLRADDPQGLLTQLVGAEHVHWTTPYRGQSKPIERAFRDLATDVAKDFRLRGAYTGNKPEAKPANYRSAAVPLAQFVQVLGEGVRLHNGRRGRRGQGLEGRSFDEAYAAGLQARAEPPARLAAEQLARWLLGAEALAAGKEDGAVRLLGTRYWAPELAQALAGRSAAERRVVVRFDPDHLDRPVLVETLDGRRIGWAEAQGAVAVLDQAAAKATAKANARLRKLAKEEAALHRSLDAADLDGLLDAAAPAAEAPEGWTERLAGGGALGGGGPEAELEAEAELASRGEAWILQAAGLGEGGGGCGD